MKKFSLARFDDSITTYDPSIGEISLRYSWVISTSDESIFLFDESIFNFLD